LRECHAMKNAGGEAARLTRKERTDAGIAQS
jgi:hypothetical protein